MKTIVMSVLVAASGCIATNDGWYPNNGGGSDTGGGGSGGTGGGSGGGSQTPQCPAGPQTLVFARDVVGGLFAGGFDGTDTVAGGTQQLTLYLYNWNGADTLLDTPFTAVGDGTGFVLDSVDGAKITMRSLGGSGYVVVKDPAGAQLGCFAMDSGTLSFLGASTVHEIFADDDIGTVYAPGNQEIGVAYFESNNGRLVDSSATLDAAGGTPLTWQTIQLANATPGMHTITATTGTGQQLAFAAQVVDHVDTIENLTQQTSLAPGEQLICLSPQSGGKFVEGSTWTVTANGVAATADPLWGPNCFDFTATAGTTVSFIAKTLDATLDLELPVTTAAAPVHPETMHRAKRALISPAR